MTEALTIGEMAKKYGVTFRLLRFYELKDLLNPERLGKGKELKDRFYDEVQQSRLEVIKKFTDAGAHLKAIKKFMDAYPGAACTSNFQNWSEDAQAAAFTILIDTRKRLRVEEMKIAKQLVAIRDMRHAIYVKPGMELE